MDISDFTSNTNKAFKLIENLRKNYGIILDCRKIDKSIENCSKKIRYLKENCNASLTDTSWAQENLLMQTLMLLKDLIAAGEVTIDSETGSPNSHQVCDGIPSKEVELTPLDRHHIISGAKDKQISHKEDTVMENHKNLSKLFESEIEKAQIVMAVRNDIVDKLQRDAEKMGNMKIDILGPIVDRIKAEHGIEAASSFRETVGTLLDQALSTLQDVQDKISTETLKLTGDVSSATDMSTDFDLEQTAQALAGGDEIPEFSVQDEFSEEELDMEPLPAEREVKESARVGIVVESKSGTTGKKFFSNKTDMHSWLTENKNKIAKVHKVIKE